MLVLALLYSLYTWFSVVNVCRAAVGSEGRPSEADRQQDGMRAARLRTGAGPGLREDPGRDARRQTLQGLSTYLLGQCPRWTPRSFRGIVEKQTLQGLHVQLRAEVHDDRCEAFWRWISGLLKRSFRNSSKKVRFVRFDRYEAIPPVHRMRLFFRLKAKFHYAI